jgi:hypothetical protein
LTEALVALGATSGSTGSSAAAGEVGGAAVAYVGDSSSSLHEDNKLWKQGKNNAIEELEYNTHDARRSKKLHIFCKTGALPAAVELDEAISSTRFLFLSTPASSASARGGDVDELVSSSDSSASSPS